MRKILSQEEIDKRAKRRGRILTLLMLLILLGSTAGYAVLSSTRSDNTPNGANGQQQSGDGRWVVNYQGGQVLLINSKQEVENISVNSIKKASDYYGQNIYVSSDNPGEYNEIRSTLGLVSSKMQEACYGSCDKNLPEKNCTDNLIVVNQTSDVQRVYERDNCIFVDGDLRAVDAFLYKIFS